MKPSEFLAEFFGPRSRELVCICSFVNDRKTVPEQIYTRDPVAADAFVKQWDQPGRGTFFGCATYPKGKTRKKANIAEIICLHSDLDFKGIDASRAEIEAILARLKRRASLIIFSGHGLHAYWLFKIATTDITRVERLLKRLAWALAGDEAVAEVARVMRLPGSHNSKFGEWASVEVVQRNAISYTLEELEAWLDAVTVPLLPRKGKATVDKATTPKADSDDGFEQAAAEQIIPEPLDIDAMWEELQYLGEGAGGNLHETQIRIGAALLSRGEPVDNIVAYIRDQLLTRVTECAGWDWQLEISRIRDQCVSWFAKHPELLDKQETKPSWLLRDDRIRRRLNGGSSEPKLKIHLDDSIKAQMRAGGNVVQLKTATKPDPVKLTYYTAEEMETWPIEDVEWIVPGFIMKNVVNGLFGDGAVGKDYLQLQLGIAVSYEVPWLGREVASGKVLYFNVEDRKERVRWRQDRIIKYLENELRKEVTARDRPDRFRLVPMLGQNTIIATFDSKSGLVQPTSIYMAMREMIEDFRPDLVMVGNRVNIFGVNQNEDSQARQCIELLNAIIIDYKTTIIMPGHVSVRGGADISGSSGSGSSGSVQWSNGLRHRLVLSRMKKSEDEELNEQEKGQRTLEVVKANDAPTGVKIELHWHETGLYVADDESIGCVEETPVDSQEHEQEVEREFLRLLDKNTAKKVNVSASPTARNNAPLLFSKDHECKFRFEKGKRELRKAMDRLFGKGMIKSADTGPPSNPRPKIERVKLHVVEKTTDKE